MMNEQLYTRENINAADRVMLEHYPKSATNPFLLSNIFMAVEAGKPIEEIAALIKNYHQDDTDERVVDIATKIKHAIAYPVTA